MGNFDTENVRYFTKNTRQSISKQIGDKIDDDIRKKLKEDKRKENLALRGNGHFVRNGSDDRIAGIPYQGDDSKYASDRQSYYYGYFYHGSRRLEAIICNLEREGKLEEIEKIGYREYNNGVNYETLSKENSNGIVSLYKHKNYADGFDLARGEDPSQRPGKHR